MAKTIIEQGYGYRAGDIYFEPNTSIADVIRHETEELDNELNILVPLDELEHISSRYGVWLTATKLDAACYENEDTGSSYKYLLEPTAFVAATDDDGGYFIVNQ